MDNAALIHSTDCLVSALSAHLPDDVKMRWSQAAKVAHWKAVDRIAQSWEPKFKRSARDGFEFDKRGVLAIIGDARKSAMRRKATIDWQSVLRDVQKWLQSTSLDNWRGLFIPRVRGVVTDQGDRWATALGMQFNVQNLEARDWFNQYTLRFAQEVSDTTERNIAEILNAAQREGASIPQVQSQLESLFDRYMTGQLPTSDTFQWFSDRTPAYRTEMIARTETIRASNAGSQEIYKDWGVAKKEWLTTIDGRERPEHAAANGQQVGIDAPFIVGGEQLQFPGDPYGSPWNTISCRCTEIPILE